MNSFYQSSQQPVRHINGANGINQVKLGGVSRTNNVIKTAQMREAVDQEYARIIGIEARKERAQSKKELRRSKR